MQDREVTPLCANINVERVGFLDESDNRVFKKNGAIVSSIWK
jgi:hypothetical protein